MRAALLGAREQPGSLHVHEAVDSDMGRARPLDSPVLPFLVALTLAALFVLFRWLVAAHRRLGAFVVAGSNFATPARVPKGLPVDSTGGYDGQFYYRLALDPFDLARSAFGIRLDSFSRVERMGYPFLAWLVSGGQHSLVPLALVVGNVVVCGIVALAGGLLAQSAGRHALWGLVFAGYWGYLWTLARDLTELTAAAFVLLGLAALVRQAPVWSGLALLGAVVSKETSVLLIGTLALAILWSRLQPERTDPVGAGDGSIPSGSPPGLASAHLSDHSDLRDLRGLHDLRGRLAPRRSELAVAIPLLGFVVWELVLWGATGKLPIYKSGQENLGTPLVGLFRGVAHYVPRLFTTASDLWVGELGILLLVVAVALLLLRAAPLEFRALLAVAVLLLLGTATGIWLGDVGFRSLDDAYLMSWLVLLYTRRPVWPQAVLAVLCAVAWGAVFYELVRFI